VEVVVKSTMAALDYNALRAQTMGSGGDEEAVTVNTRALIDKVLARYSGEWTTLRELIQNAADAQATSVKIKFETIPSAQVPLANTTNQSEILKHVLLNHTLRRLVVSNDGQPFGVNDWNRLKRIAEGNPDETKIGAFGVGFYSVFADCEDPFVSSGNEAMAFYWKGNSLFTRRLQLSEGQGSKETSFVLDYRNATTSVPNLLSIAQFLATSLTFVALQHIELWLDDWKIISLQKKAAPSVDVPISRDVERKTREGVMYVQSLERESVQMDATFMNVVGWKPAANVSKPANFGDSSYGNSNEVSSLRSFFSRLSATSNVNAAKKKAHEEEKAMQEIVLEDLTATSTANVFLRVTTANIKTNVSAAFAAELERATKKPPPKTTKLAILTSSYDEETASQNLTKAKSVAEVVDVFSSVLPGRKPGGRIFIGFPTHQTTGAGLHLSAPSVIPTVERESIDLNARWVRSWNMEMLRAAGIMSRLAFASEMAELSAKVKRATEAAGGGSKVTREIIAKLLPEAMHILKTFTFSESTPSAHVSQLIEEAFWMAYKVPSVDVYSSQGILPTTKVRLATEDLSGFVEGIPVIPDELVKDKFITKLRDFGLITEITVGDVKHELEAKALNKEQLTQFLSWIGRKAITRSIDAPTIHSLMDVAIATIGEGDNSGSVLALGTITNYLNASKIASELPVPPTTLPFEFSRHTTSEQLQALGWEQLEIVPWVRYLIESSNGRGLSLDQDITKSPKFAAQVLAVLSKQWDTLSQSSKASIVALLKPLTVVPTKFGMKKPEQSYFPSVKLFDDLPIITSCPGVKEKVFVALGVRKTVDLETIFTRLLSQPTADATDGEKASKKWSHVDLIKYLASVKDDIPISDLIRLKSTPLCPAAAGPAGQESSQGTARLYKVSELFEPKIELHKLGFPIIQWPGTGGYRPGSSEGRFLSSLGLRAYPSVPELIDVMACDDIALRNLAMSYFIINHSMNGYAAFNAIASPKKFLPLQDDEKRLVSPAECFTNEKSTVFGFHLLRNDLHAHANKFGVATDPNMSVCVDRLIAKPPQTCRDAVPLFGYFASRITEIGPTSISKLADAPIVPVVSKSTKFDGDEKAKERIRYISPRSCYVGESTQYKDIFDFVNFGQEANFFLLKCGSKHEPSRKEIAQRACKEPARLLSILESPQKYLDLLRFLADGLNDLKKDKELFRQLKSAPFLLASKDIPNNPPKYEAAMGKEDSEDDYLEEGDEDAYMKHYQLAPASDVVVVDDVNSFFIFRKSLLCCPQEDTLEAFYLALGVPLLGSIVQKDTRVGGVLPKQDGADKLKKHVLERSRIFLSNDNSRDTIKHDARWLEKNLTVQMVDTVSLRRSLPKQGLTHTEKRSAAISSDSGRTAILYVTRRYEYYQISSVLVGLLLTRVRPHSASTFETILANDLMGLRARGYNVDRILRVKAAEFRIAEEQRQKQLEEEQAKIREQEQQWKNNQAAAAARDDRRNSSQVAMPGAFDASPENSPVAAKKPRDFFGGLTKRLGLGDGEATKQLQKLMGNTPEEEQRALTGPSTASNPSPQPTAARPPGEPEHVTAPHELHQNLINAVQASRAHDSSTLFSPPNTNTVKETSGTTYCDTQHGHDLKFLADASNGMRIFTSKNLSIPPTDFLSKNVSGLNTFAGVLRDVGEIFGIQRTALHVFYDEDGPTIAFNRDGSVFCNYRYFSQLHRKDIDAGKGRVEATTWWWVTVAHELAHNLVKDHSAAHSYYT
jgi:hypothetical protein